MHSQYQNETNDGSRVEARPASNTYLLLKAFLYLAAGIIGIDFIARITLGQ